MPREFDKLAKKLKHRKGVDNPFALARSILGSDAQIKADRKHKKGRMKGKSGR